MREPTDPSTLPPIHPSMRLLLLLILRRTVGGGKAYSICPSVKAAGYTLTTSEVYLQVDLQNKKLFAQQKEAGHIEGTDMNTGKIPSRVFSPLARCHTREFLP